MGVKYIVFYEFGCLVQILCGSENRKDCEVLENNFKFLEYDFYESKIEWVHLDKQIEI